MNAAEEIFLSMKGGHKKLSAVVYHAALRVAATMMNNAIDCIDKGKPEFAKETLIQGLDGIAKILREGQ